MNLYAETILPTVWGNFRCLVFRDANNVEYIAMLKGEQHNSVLCRIHSECFTGEVLGSTKCDCKQQLDRAFEEIAREGGVLIYLHQEGRGIGLGNKIKAYALQETGLDTVDANRKLGFYDDERQYDVAVEILKELKIHSVKLMTNNPAKIKALEAAGILVSHRAHKVSPIYDEAKNYIAVKQHRMGHF